MKKTIEEGRKLLSSNEFKEDHRSGKRFFTREKVTWEAKRFRFKPILLFLLSTVQLDSYYDNL